MNDDLVRDLRHTAAEQASARQYFREFGLAMLAYAVVLIAATSAIKWAPSWRVPLALAPVLPLAFALVAALRFLRRMDEFNRALQFEAVGFAFTAGVMATMTWGLLEAMAGFPRLSWTFVPPVFLLLYGVGGFLARRRYQ